MLDLLPHQRGYLAALFDEKLFVIYRSLGRRAAQIDIIYYKPPESIMPLLLLLGWSEVRKDGRAHLLRKEKIAGLLDLIEPFVISKKHKLLEIRNALEGMKIDF